MKPLSFVVSVVGAVIAGAGIVGVLAPSVVLGFGSVLLTPAALYIVAAVRVVFGASLLWVAPVSRMPMTLRGLGIVIVAAGILTPAFGVERSEALLHWWSSQDPLLFRAFSVLPIALGVFLMYAVSRGRRLAA